MFNRNPQQPQSNPVVRRAGFDRALERFNEEIAHKTARLIAEFHLSAVHPRLVELEMRWYQRLWRIVCWAWKLLRLDRLFSWVVRGLWLDRLCRWVVGRLRQARVWRKIRRLPPEETLPYKVDEAVRTTEKGVALFKGEPQEGVVTKVGKDRVWVRCPGMTVPQEFSPSVWEVLDLKPKEHEASPED